MELASTLEIADNVAVALVLRHSAALLIVMIEDNISQIKPGVLMALSAASKDMASSVCFCAMQAFDISSSRLAVFAASCVSAKIAMELLSLLVCE